MQSCKSSFCTFAANIRSMMRKLTFIFISLLFLFACSEISQDKNATISGIVPLLQNKMIFLEEMEPFEAIPLDSAIVDAEGKFNFNLAVSDAGFYLLRAKENNILVLLIEENESISLLDTSKVFGTEVLLEGSPGSLLILEFESHMKFQEQRINSLAEEYYKARGTPEYETTKASLDSTYQSYVEDQRIYIFNFVEEHPGSLASLLVINRKLGMTEVIDEMKDYAFLYKLDSTLQVKYPNNKHSKDHHERVKTLKGEIFDQYVIEEKLQPGRKAPDLVLPDTLGDPLSLKTYTGQKVILYFWAGWEARSRQDNRRLRSIYPELQSNNIEIIGVSLDENEVVWKGAIRLDKLAWPQVSDLKGMYSGIKKDYNILDELPFYYLIDEKQKIEYKHQNLDSILVRLK